MASPVTLNEIVSGMRRALALSEPDLDTTIGTPVRKILDAVGEVVAEVSVDRYMLDYQYDIDTKMGPDLDEFVRLFGFTRLAAKRATGMVTFERTTAATTDVLIPVGSQITTQGANPIAVQTVSPALMVEGQTSIDVPVQAVVGGTAGNVPANSLRYRVTPFLGIASFTNTVALTGGTDAESDQQLRDRFIQTVFRNMAGTEHQFLATALDDESVTRANVLGAAKTYRERVQVVSGTVTSTLPSARYIYPNSQAFGPDLEGGDILIPGVHYSFNSGVIPPTVTILDTVAAPDGIYEWEYEYVPTASRNDPSNGVTNRVDIYVTGQRATEATESLTFRTAKTFNTTVGSALNRTNFQRTDTTMPVSGNYFIAFSMSPVIDPAVNQTIVINGTSYTEGTDFWLVNDITREGGSPDSFSGVEFKSAANGQIKPIPADGQSFTVDYIFNAVPRDVETKVREWRLITTDVRVHAAKPIYLDMHLALIYSPGFNEGIVRPTLEASLRNYVSSVGFNGTVQVSSLLEIAQGTVGVDAVRFLTSSDDATHYAIQRVSADGNTVITTYATNVGGQIRRALDVTLNEDEYAALNDLVLVPKALNTFGAV